MNLSKWINFSAKFNTFTTFFFHKSSWPCLHQNDKVNRIFTFIEFTCQNVSYVLTSITTAYWLHHSLWPIINFRFSLNLTCSLFTVVAIICSLFHIIFINIFLYLKNNNFHVLLSIHFTYLLFIQRNAQVSIFLRNIVQFKFHKLLLFYINIITLQLKRIQFLKV